MHLKHVFVSFECTEVVNDVDNICEARPPGVSSCCLADKQCGVRVEVGLSIPHRHSSVSSPWVVQESVFPPLDEMYQTTLVTSNYIKRNDLLQNTNIVTVA